MIYRGVIHVHSTHSYDGKVSLTELKAMLQSCGVSFACMTEHADKLTKEAATAFVAECQQLSDASFVFVPGFEVPYKDAHVLHIGATTFVASVAHNAETLAAWRREAPLVVLAHPVRNRFVVDEVLLRQLDGIEVWNQQYDGKRLPRTKSVALLTSLRRQKELIATGGIDLHRREHLGSPYTTLELPVLTTAAIVAALKAGQGRFGYEEFWFDAITPWVPTWHARLQSVYACSVIVLGKGVNAVLAKLGLRLPKGLVRMIRARV